MKKRKARQIKIWMIRNNIFQKDIVAATSVNQGYVSHTLKGNKNNRKVLVFLLNNGCPKSYLALPRDMEEAA